MVTLQLLGGLAIDAPELSVSARSRRRHPLAMLALVAAAAPQAVARDRLMGLLWPESDGERASNSLRQTIFWLRKDLGEDIFLAESASGIQLDASKVAVDLWTFRDALADQRVADAVAAYTGPFLDGFQLPGTADFSRWVESERDALERQFLQLLDAAARTAEESGRFDEAVNWRRRQAAAEPYSSRVALALIKSLSAAGDRPGALEYAGVYEAMVRSHLEATPDPAVAEYVARLRSEVGPVRLPATAVVEWPEQAQVSTEPRRRSRKPFIAAAIVMALALIAWFVFRPRDTTIVLASAAGNSGRDAHTNLIACDGPACPDGALPQRAFIVPRHEFYSTPVTGTGYIAPLANATIASDPGYDCCTIATFERVFALPPEAIAGRLIVSVLADNQAFVSINGVEFGAQTDSLDVGNYSDPSVFTTTFPPDPSGTNRLRIRLWDGGGAIALSYHATITYEVDQAAKAK